MSEDKFLDLPHMTWRGIILPVADRNHRFAHEGTEHQIIYRNGSAIEMMGASARVFSYTLPMREGVTKGPYANLFSSRLLEFWRAYYGDKSPGILYDPIYGEVTCVPQEWDETTDVTRRDGVDVRVSFKEHIAIEGGVETAPPSLDSIASEATRLDESVAAVSWDVQSPPPESKANILSVASGLIQQGNFAVSRMKAQVQEYAMRCSEIEDAADKAMANSVVGAGALRRDSRSSRLNAYKVASSPTRDAQSEVIQVVTMVERNTFETAKALGISVELLLQLNPSLARRQKIPAGTRLWTRRARR